MLCPVCGFELNDSDRVCPLCGAQIEINRQDSNTKEPEESADTADKRPSGEKKEESRKEVRPDKQDRAGASGKKDKSAAPREQATSNQPSVNQAENGGEQKSKRRVWIVVLICIIVVVCVVLVLFFTGVIGSDRTNTEASSESETEQAVEEESESEVNDVDVEEVVEEESDAAAEESAAETQEVSVQTAEANVAPSTNFIGYWNTIGDDTTELTISNVTGNTVEFTLWGYRAFTIENAIAYTNDQNMASFNYTSDGMTVAGNLIFYEDYIVVDITRADDMFLNTGAMVFNERHLSSWLETGNDALDSYYDYDYYYDYDTSYFYDAYYVIPDSSSVILDYNDIRYLTQEELRLARNEIYARHGRRFDDETLQTYFDSQPWYYGYIEPEDFDSNVLSDIERANISFIESYEQ